MLQVPTAVHCTDPSGIKLRLSKDKALDAKAGAVILKLK